MKNNLTTKFSSVILIAMLALAAIGIKPVQAAATDEIVPTGNGSYTAWTGNYTLVDEGTASANCSGGDYITSSITNARESVSIPLTSIPDGSTITSIVVLARDRGDTTTGGTYATFVRFNGSDSEISAIHTATGTAVGCTGSRADTFDVFDTPKNGSTTLEIGVVKINSISLRVGVLSAVITYTLPTIITVGDGTSPADKSVKGLDTNKAVSAFTLAINSGSDFVTALTVTGSGTGLANVAANGVKLWEDSGSNPNEWDATDKPIGTGVSFSGTTASFSALSIPVTTIAVQYLITFDIIASPTNDQTMQAAVTSVTAMNTVVNNDNTDATLTVDNIAPTVTVTTFPAVNNTNKYAVTLSGACENGSGTVSLAVTDAGAVHTVYASPSCASGAWTASWLNLSTLNDGTLTATATQADAAGNVGTGTKNALKDVVAPTVTVTTFPTVNDANKAAVTLSGACETGSGTVSLAVTDAGPVHTVNASLSCSAGAWTASSLDLSTLNDGTLTATAAQTDAAGNVGTGTKIAAKDVVAPIVTIDTKPADPTNITSAAFTFTISESVTLIECKLDAGLYAPCDTSHSQSYAGPLTAGLHTFSVRVTDAAANSNTAVYTWVIDSTAPNVTIVARPANPTSSTSAAFTFTSDGSPTATDCKLDGAAFAACSTPASQSYAGPLAEGAHTFSVRVTNAAAKTSTATYTWVIDTTVPIITIMNPNTAAAQSKTITASTSEGTLMMSNTTGSTCNGTLTFVAYSSQVFTSEADNGIKVCYRAVDAAGNTAYSLSNAISGIDTTAPTVSLSAPSRAITNAGPVDFYVTIAGANTIHLLAGNVTLLATGTASGTITVLNGTTATPTVRISGITGDGTLGISIAAGIASDIAGNTSVTTGPSTTITVDNTRPVLSIGDPSQPITKDYPVEFPITVAGADTIHLGVENVTLHKTGTAKGTVSVDNGTPANPIVRISSITGDGTLGISIAGGVASDAAGNITFPAGPSTTFTVDNTAPMVFIGAPSLALTNIGPVDFLVTVAGADTINLSAGDIALNATGTATGTISVLDGTTANPTVRISAISGEGTLGISIAAGIAIDAARNTTAAAGPSTIFIVIADNTPPETWIIDKPASLDNNSNPTFTFSGFDGLGGSGVAYFMCRMDASVYTVCSSPYTLPTLEDGWHTFYVFAVDMVGNADLSPDSYTWTLNTNSPNIISITRASPDPTMAATVEFTVTFSKDVTGVDAGDFTLTTTGNITGESVTGVSGGPLVYTVSINTGSGGGTLRLDVPASATISSPGGLLAGLPYTSGETYTKAFFIFIPFILR